MSRAEGHPELATLQDALEHRLAAADRIELDEHLRSCAACRRQMHALRWTSVRLAGAASSLPIPPSLSTELQRMLAGPPVSSPIPPDDPQPPDRPPAAGWRRWMAGWRTGG